MKNILMLILAGFLFSSCGILDSGDDEIIKEEFIPFVEINEVKFSENEALVTATIAKPSPCWSYLSTNILLRDGGYYFAARGQVRSDAVCPAVIVTEKVSFNVKLQPYGDIHFNFLNYDNTYIDTLVSPGG